MFEPSRIYRSFIAPQFLKLGSGVGAIFPMLFAALVFQPTVRAADVQLLAPANGANYALNATVFLSATVSDGDGIDFVDFLRNGTSIGRAAKSPGDLNHYSLVWIASEAGTQTIAVRATDLLGNVTTSPTVTITVGGSQPPADTTPPSVQMLAPANNSTINSGATVTFSASATDSQSAIAFVDFYRNGTVFARGVAVAGQPNQFSATWLANASGQQSFSARAVDSAGNASTSIAITVNVASVPPPDTTPPVVQIVAPANSSNVNAGSTVSLAATASDTQGTVTAVDFYRNGTLLGRAVPVAGAPNRYAFFWSANALGQHGITARATDNAGNESTSAAITINVVNPTPEPPPNTPPTIAIVAPSANATLTLSPISLSGSVSDSDGTVRKVEFFANNQSVGSRDVSTSQGTISLTWRPRAAGTYQISARATDNRGATTTSSAVQVTLRAPDPGPTTPPGEITAVRSLPTYYRAWHPFQVEIKVTASTAWKISEKPPKGWRVIGVSDGGKYSEANHTVTFNSDKSRTVKYHLFPPRYAKGPQTISGTITAGSKTLPISGQSQIGDQDNKDEERDCVVKIKKGKRGHSELRFKTKKGGRWVVEFCDSVAQQDWKALPGGFFSVSDQDELSIEDPDESAPLRFYRLRCLR
jgi:hypothetical protein